MDWLSNSVAPSLSLSLSMYVSVCLSVIKGLYLNVYSDAIEINVNYFIDGAPIADLCPCSYLLIRHNYVCGWVYVCVYPCILVLVLWGRICSCNCSGALFELRYFPIQSHFPIHEMFSFTVYPPVLPLFHPLSLFSILLLPLCPCVFPVFINFYDFSTPESVSLSLRCFFPCFFFEHFDNSLQLSGFVLVISPHYPPSLSIALHSWILIYRRVVLSFVFVVNNCNLM